MEFRGLIIDALPVDERMALANMKIEFGAMCGLIDPNWVTHQYLREHNNLEHRGNQDLIGAVMGNPDAVYEQVYQLDLSDLEPQVACPSKPDQVVGVSQLGEVAITKSFIGFCTGGKLLDIAQAAQVLKDQQVTPGLELFVMSVSQWVRQQAEAPGYFEILQQAGTQILKSSCGACINAGMRVLEREELTGYTTNRIFNGRSGDPTCRNYLASSRVVAISAVQGKISDRLE